MVDFSIYPFPEETQAELSKIKIEYAFQPIFDRHNEIFAYEALMRPAGKTVIELIEEYSKKDKLHILEVATMFGAFQEYEKKGYDKNICINSFPTECLTDYENELYNKTFPISKCKGIVELLEYPIDQVSMWEEKKKHLSLENVPIAVDDFGVGLNNAEAVDLYKPNIVKLDRSLISDINTNTRKKEACVKWIKRFHADGYLVLAEGIETEAEYRYLHDVDIDLFQGFYLGMPI